MSSAKAWVFYYHTEGRTDIVEPSTASAPNSWAHCLPSQHPSMSFESLSALDAFFHTVPCFSSYAAFVTNPIPPMSGGVLTQVRDASAPHSFV